MEEFSLTDLTAPLKANLGLIAIITIVVTVLAVAYTYFMVPTSWKTETSIVFEDASPGADLMSKYASLSGLAPSGGRGEFLQVLLNSRSVRGRVVDEMNLTEHFETESRNGAIGQLRETYSAELPVSKVLVLTVSWEGEPRATLTDEKPEAARMVAEVASHLIASLEKEISRNDYTEAVRRRKMLEEQLQRATKELTKAEDELVQFATTEGLVDVSDQGQAIVSQLEELQKREAELQANLEGAQAREAAANSQLSDQERMAVSNLTESRDPAIDKLRQRIIDLEQRITEQKEVQGKSEQHPDVASLISELESAQQQVGELVQSEMQLERRSMSVDPAYSELVSEALTNSQRAQEIEANIDGVRSRKREILSELEQFPAKSRSYERLRREVNMRSQAVVRLTESYDLARLAEESSTASFSVIDEPIVPAKPSEPSLRKNAALAFVVSFIFSVLLVYWLHGRRATAASEEKSEAAAS